MSQLEKKQKRLNVKQWLKANWISMAVLLLLLAVGVVLYVVAHPAASEDAVRPTDYTEYENAVVREILADSCEADEISEGHYRGQQLLTAEVLSGQYKGETMLVDNVVGPVYGEKLEAGDRVTVSISTYEDGTVRAAVYESDRSIAVYLLIGAFLLITVLVGGKVGLKSLLGLALTVGALLFILLPLLLKGWPTILTTFMISVLVAAIAFVILGGVNRKTNCAFLGTFAGIALATVFGLVAQRMLHIDGYRHEYGEALLQLRQTGESMIGITGLIVAGVVVSALGAVMDVAMSIASAIHELAEVGENMTVRRLFKSGMNIGRDMVGTMTNTLILAIIGSGLTLIVYIYSLGLPATQFLSSPYLALEMVSGIASSCGVVLAVPFTALVSAVAYGKKEKSRENK